MTISLAWMRSVNTVKELVVLTDSRLGFGCRWDCCPKLQALPRGDSVVCFAGDTMYAYPIMLQINAAVAQHPRLLSRGMDIEDLKGHLLRILNAMTDLVQDLPPGIKNEPETTFLLAGWSWRSSNYRVWLLHFDPHIKKFTFRPSRKWKGQNKDKYLAYPGDCGDDFKHRLIELLRSKNKLESDGFDMEPFEVLRDMLRSGKYDLIGGAPQIMKVYRHSSTMPYAVFWPNKASNQISLLGRPMLDYEKSEYLVLDPDTLKTVKHVDVA